jgi:hypothetical protein
MDRLNLSILTESHNVRLEQYPSYEQLLHFSSDMPSATLLLKTQQLLLQLRIVWPRLTSFATQSEATDNAVTRCYTYE